MAETRTVHFPPAAREPAPAESALEKRGREVRERKAEPGVNAIAQLADALREVETVRVKLRGMLVTDNRHGDLFVCLGAVRRLETAIQALIEVEEGAP
jgi:hypothetical protein